MEFVKLVSRQHLTFKSECNSGKVMVFKNFTSNWYSCSPQSITECPRPRKQNKLNTNSSAAVIVMGIACHFVGLELQNVSIPKLKKKKHFNSLQTQSKQKQTAVTIQIEEHFTVWRFSQIKRN